MSLYYQLKQSDKILFVNSISPTQYEALDTFSRIIGHEVRGILLTDRKKVLKDWIKDTPKLTKITVDFSDPEAIQKALLPYDDEIIVTTCLGESNIPHLKTVIPFVPHCNLPTETSLEWTTEKIKMRGLLRSYDKNIGPKFTVARDASQATIDKIEKQVGYPLIVKPSGLAASLLVSICYHREELEAILEKTMSKIEEIYKAKNGRGEPQVLVEEFMEGDMYSVDAYINQRGIMYFTPMVYVKTGREIGFDDFFGYMRMTPTQLSAPHIKDAQEVAAKSIKALRLRSTVCHIELLRTEKGWKVIELGPRIGGFRHEMYSLSFGIDHSLNDMLIRVPHKPVIPKKVKGYTAVLQYYAKTEGTLQHVIGLERVKTLNTLQLLKVRKKDGESCLFAKHGGDPVFEVTLFDPIRSNVLADIRRIEQHVEIIVV
jgi:hypothetical protein